MHPGGPFWKYKDDGAWSLPKGEFTADEDALEAAKREFLEETGFKVDGAFIRLTPVQLKSGKWVYAWGIETDLDASTIVSNMISLEWPPKSSRFINVPEVDKAGWFDKETALKKINAAQAALIIELSNILE